MSAKKQDKVLIACPHCGHQQMEPRSAYSTNCKKCGQHLRVQDILNPASPAPRRTPEQRRVTCFECGVELDVPASAESTMCKRCGRYVDLQDYHITNAIAKNFKTKGVFVIEPKGCVFNTESIVGDAVIRGQFHGKLAVERSLTIYSTADIKGSLTAAHLIIPPENHFRWPDSLKVGSAEIAGELAANLRARDSVVLKSTARLFGDVDARHFMVEDGAVVVGKMQIGPRTGSQQSRLL
jgi:cytoskeletal protein CcmA (bactofilin family)/DNA-directed RNA polymerase subunit RPC12/RpoP